MDHLKVFLKCFIKRGTYKQSVITKSFNYIYIM